MRSQDYEELNSLVKGLLKMGYIHESMSPCGAVDTKNRWELAGHQLDYGQVYLLGR